MTTSEAFVHVWLPGSATPVLCGRLRCRERETTWQYARSYLDLPSAIALDPEELPLGRERHRVASGDLPGVIRDASPDAWGRRVLENRLATTALSELDYLVEAGTDRIGALVATRGAGDDPTSVGGPATLDDLVRTAELIAAGEPVPAELDAALVHGSSIGGARPKALLSDGSTKLIAKFASSDDTYPVVRCEYACMELARRCGVDAAGVELTRSLHKDVLLVRRFDRVASGQHFHRRLMASGLTLLALHESEARLASYLDLAGVIRRRGARWPADAHELFRRMVVNILVGNTDDHARNHAFFWDGEAYSLAPAYDIVPSLRHGRTAAQAMVVGTDGRAATLRNALSRCELFGLERREAETLQRELVERARVAWPECAALAGLTDAQRRQLEREIAT